MIWKPRAITGLPHFFSDSFLALPGVGAFLPVATPIGMTFAAGREPLSRISAPPSSAGPEEAPAFPQTTRGVEARQDGSPGH